MEEGTDLEVVTGKVGGSNMSEVIVITSGKGGVGKTTTTANVGTGLAKMDRKVVLIDTDIGLRNLDVVMGLENRIIYNLVDVVEGNCRMKQALIKDKRYPNLFLLPSAQTRDKSSVTPGQMKKLVEDLREEFVSRVKENVKSKKFLTQNIQEIWDTMKRPNLKIIGIEEGEESQLKGPENIFNKIIEENFPNLKEEMVINVQEAYRTPN